MNKNPLISIVVPVYGTEGYFDRCIKSLLGQSYKNIEIIVVNDGSKGNISERIKNYSSDKRVVFIDNKVNRGLLRARVCGASKAKGEYIAFVDSDDYVSHDYYRVQISKALKTDADIVIGKTVWEDSNKKFIYNLHESNFRFDVLVGEEIKKAYFTQETQCYSWHTIWNKLYKKSLWNKCMPEYETVDEHIIMTEDIYFSSILFYNAEKVSRTNSEAYFYCSNENASTNSNGISPERFKKNIGDISYVFNKVESYLKFNNAADYVIEGLERGKSHYARMWKNLAQHTFTEDELKASLAAVDDFCSEYGTQNVQDDYFFESIQTPWYGRLEYIKKQLKEAKQEYISFDIFDTLILRPFYEPDDIFKMMNKEFARLTDSAISFSKLRVEGEKLARQFWGNQKGYEDISIDEIYDYISEHYKVDSGITDRMKQLEKELEFNYCYSRNAGIELYDFAKACGKKVVLISDMYLSRETVECILAKNDINGYEQLFLSYEKRRLKYNGGLFNCALNELNISADNLIHIGDTWSSDIEGSKLAGIESIFFPKAIEVFENKINGCPTNRCACIADTVRGGIRKQESNKENLGYRCMMALVANTYFDNPYREFNANSDFNADPYFIGFYPLGMHITGISKWLNELCAANNYDHIAFLARDGYLPMKAFEEYKKHSGLKADTSYMQASRKAVMPFMLKDRLSFYQMPIEYRAHSPETLLDVLGFAFDTNKPESDKWRDLAEEKGISPEKTFESKEELDEFISFFLDELYDVKKHEREQRKAEKYFSRIPDNSVLFDMGYSGRIQSAICRAAGKSVDAAFIHEDYQTSVEMRKRYGFKITNFYDYVPEVSGLIREHVFSAPTGSCIGFSEENGCVLPIIEEDKHQYQDKFVINSLHKGATDFIKKFLGIFSENLDDIDCSPNEVSMPFEGFIRYPSRQDMHIFSASYFEDMVFGAKQKINIEEFVVSFLMSKDWLLETSAPEYEEEMLKAEQNDKQIMDMINQSSQLKRAMVWLMLDFSYFKNKLSKNIDRRRKK